MHVPSQAAELSRVTALLSAAHAELAGVDAAAAAALAAAPQLRDDDCGVADDDIALAAAAAAAAATSPDSIGTSASAEAGRAPPQRGAVRPTALFALSATGDAHGGHGRGADGAAVAPHWAPTDPPCFALHAGAVRTALEALLHRLGRAAAAIEARGRMRKRVRERGGTGVPCAPR
jgi:hypothetical protein